VAALIYYRREARRHPGLAAKALTYREARRIARLLRAAYGLTYKVRRHSTRRRNRHRAWFNAHRDLVVFPRGSTTLLVVIHEVAHAMDWYGNLRRAPARWHSARHTALVDTIAQYVTALGWHRDVPPASSSRSVRTAAA
jgi:hypothetical protein